MADLATLQARLAEAEEARHELKLGNRAELMAHGERRMQFTPADHARLDAYIAELRQQISGKRRGRNRIRYVVAC